VGTSDVQAVGRVVPQLLALCSRINTQLQQYVYGNLVDNFVATSQKELILRRHDRISEAPHAKPTFFRLPALTNCSGYIEDHTVM